MSNYVIKYSRGERVKYISHLDFVRMFHRAVRRAGIDFVFSSGFNPHPIMTVALPLSVGVTADGELMRVGFDSEFSQEQIVTLLNDSLPDGYKIVKLIKCDGKTPDFNSIEKAEYIIDAECTGADKLSCEDFLKNTQIVVPKRTKSGEKDTDIREMIYSVEKIAPQNGDMALKVCIAAGNSQNLKPETLVAAINKYCPDTQIGFFSVHRNALLDKDGKELI